MKNIRFLLFVATMTPTALWLFGCSKNDNASTTVDKVTARAQDVGANVHAAVSDTWDGIKGYTIEKRAEFSASVDRMAGHLDDKTRELKAKFSGAPTTAATDREKAIAEYDHARAELKSRLSELSNATADTWADAKQKVAQAWEHVQAAYDKLTSSAAS